jgi:putative redox protein
MITTTFVDDYKFESVNEHGNVNHIDMLPAHEKEHMSPTELLLSSLSACASVDLVEMLKKRRKTVSGLTIEADGERREEHPRAFTSITLKFILESPDAKQEEFEKLGHLAATKYCSVASTLGANIKHEFVIKR